MASPDVEWTAVAHPMASPDVECTAEYDAVAIANHIILFITPRMELITSSIISGIHY